MNGKKSKQIRNIAKALTTENPDKLQEQIKKLKSIYKESKGK